LLIVALVLRMESINRKTEMNELRISKVESRVETESLQTTDHKKEMEIPELVKVLVFLIVSFIFYII